MPSNCPSEANLLREGFAYFSTPQQLSAHILRHKHDGKICPWSHFPVILKILPSYWEE